jgi:hypothetical protein
VEIEAELVHRSYEGPYYPQEGWCAQIALRRSFTTSQELFLICPDSEYPTQLIHPS